MSTKFVTRHPGALDWLKSQYPSIAESATTFSHFDVTKDVEAGDVVVGVLPVNLVADVCSRKARFIALQMVLPAEMRGKELSEADMISCGASLQEYHVEAINTEA